jgi:hypothetical protein
MRVFPKGIPLSDPAITAMNVEFGTLIAGNVARAINSLALRAVGA